MPCNAKATALISRELDMSPKKEPSHPLHQITALRQKRIAQATEIIGELLDAVDVYLWHIDRWIEGPEAAHQPITDHLDCPQRCVEISLWGFLNTALEGLTTAAECLRAGIAYPGAWLLRNLLEARINAMFIAHELTGLAGQRWINYNAQQVAKLATDSEEAKEIIAAIKARFPHDDIRAGKVWWPKTEDTNGNPKGPLNLTARAVYLDKLNPPGSQFLQDLRQTIRQYETDTIKKANLVVHPMLTAHNTAPHPIMVLYQGSQAAWDTLSAYTAHLTPNLPDQILQAHDKLQVTAIKVGSERTAPDQ